MGLEFSDPQVGEPLSAFTPFIELGTITYEHTIDILTILSTEMRLSFLEWIIDASDTSSPPRISPTINPYITCEKWADFLCFDPRSFEGSSACDACDRVFQTSSIEFFSYEQLECTARALAIEHRVHLVDALAKNEARRAAGFLAFLYSTGHTIQIPKEGPFSSLPPCEEFWSVRLIAALDQGNDERIMQSILLKAAGYARGWFFEHANRVEEGNCRDFFTYRVSSLPTNQ